MAVEEEGDSGCAIRTPKLKVKNNTLFNGIWCMQKRIVGLEGLNPLTSSGALL
jgi:hypothetical protein